MSSMLQCFNKNLSIYPFKSCYSKLNTCINTGLCLAMFNVKHGRDKKTILLN